MESLVIVIFFILLMIIVYYGQLNDVHSSYPIRDTSGHVKPEHLLYDILKQFSSGDKLYLAGKCRVNLYTQYIITVDMKQSFTLLINNIFKSVYDVTHELFQVQALNNIYEQIDDKDNKRYIIDATLNAVSNYYTVRVLLDIVIVDNEIYVNLISVNNASNNNIIDRYDITFQDQGILLNHNNFSTNIRSLLDQEYHNNYRLIAFNSNQLDSKNYEFENVLSLNSLLKIYLPSTLSSESEKDLKMKGVKGQLEMYLPPNLSMAKSPQFCNKYLNGWTSDGVNMPGNESCVFDHNNVETEYNQPYMAPGQFFNRSSLPKQGY